jgi:hypothetical protein
MKSKKRRLLWLVVALLCFPMTAMSGSDYFNETQRIADSLYKELPVVGKGGYSADAGRLKLTNDSLFSATLEKYAVEKRGEGSALLIWEINRQVAGMMLLLRWLKTEDRDVAMGSIEAASYEGHETSTIALLDSLNDNNDGLEFIHCDWVKAAEMAGAYIAKMKAIELKVRRVRRQARGY